MQSIRFVIPLEGSSMSSFIPDTAPFDDQQRAWLNGFFAGLMGLSESQSGATAQAGVDAAATAGLLRGAVATLDPPQGETEEDFPWHDASLSMDERIELAKDQGIERKLMAAMAQLDCGSCGYVCKTYAEAIASGGEKNLTLCSPGGKETKQMIKLLLKDGSEAGKTNGHVTANNGAHGNGHAANGHANAHPDPVRVAAGYDRQNPFSAPLIEASKLNNAGSAKDVRHVVIDLSGSGLNYEVGDALGVYPVNCDQLAATIVTRLGADPSTRVRVPDGCEMQLIDALREVYCLRDANDELLELLAGRIDVATAKASLEQMLSDGTPPGFDVLDALDLAPRATVTATEVLETLSPLNPRLYSIASSMKKVGQQVHLTIGKVTYEHAGRVRKGVASTMLAERMQPGDRLRVFVQSNHGGFTVPQSDETPMIMVGPGTGIAPFIAFLQERQSRRACGKNWLFFGDQHQACDFLYEQELKEYTQSGLLTRLDTAFSRDGDEKIYVQDRMRQRAAELWSWLSAGGHFYVCGDASRMAADVERALLDIITSQAAMDTAAAKAYLKNLAATGRYVRDVY